MYQRNEEHRHKKKTSKPQIDIEGWSGLEQIINYLYLAIIHLPLPLGTIILSVPFMIIFAIVDDLDVPMEEEEWLH